MKLELFKSIRKISIHCKDQTVYRVNNEFLNFTGYSNDSIIGMSIHEVSVLLKLDHQTCLENIDDMSNCYLFTKDNEPIEINIYSEYNIDNQTKVYHFESVKNTSLDNLNRNIFSVNCDYKKSIALYSIDNSILLKTNENYIDLISSLYPSTKDLIGKPPVSSDLILSCDVDDTGVNKKEVKFKNKEGCFVYFDLTTIPLYIDGKKKYILNTICNVTEIVSTRNHINKQRKLLKTILDNISDKIGIINKKGEYTYKNKATRNIIEATSNTADSNDTRDNSKEVYDKVKFYNIEGLEIPFESMPAQKVLRGEKFSNYIVLGITDDSSQYNKAHGIPIYDDNNNLNGGVLIYEDITDKIILEEYNSFKEKTQNTLLNYATLSYPQFNILYVNNEAYHTMKKNHPEIKSQLSLIGKNFFEFSNLSNAEKINIKENINKFVTQKVSSYIYTQKIPGHKKDMYMKIIFQPVYNSDKTVDKINILGIDITDEKEDNEKMYKTLKTQDDSFENTSHELRTPLNLISSATQLLDSYLKSDISKDKMIATNQIVIKNSYRLKKLINDILDSTNLKEGLEKLNLKNVDIVYITEDIIQSVSSYVSERGLKIVFDTDIEEKIIQLDTYKFEKIMLNLISNAIKFSDLGDIIFITISNKDEYVEICIKDEGIGIDEKSLNNIFDKFYRADNSSNKNFEGTGIGLYIVKSLVKLHRGNISVESTVDEGTTFTLKFPSVILKNKNASNYSFDTTNRSEVINTELSDI